MPGMWNIFISGIPFYNTFELSYLCVSFLFMHCNEYQGFYDHQEAEFSMYGANVSVPAIQTPSYAAEVAWNCPEV